MGSTHVILVVDHSGSMASCREGAEQALAKQIRAIKDGAAKAGDNTKISLITFESGAIEVKVDSIPYFNMREDYTICPGGSTPLYDAVKRAVDMLAPYDAVLVYTITDGFENSSFCNKAELLGRIKLLIATDRWTFAFQVPKGNKASFLREFPVSDGCVMEWETTNKGAAVASQQTQSSVASYYTARASGKTATKNFFVQTNVKKVNPNVLSDVTAKYTLATVAKEESIENFVQRRTRKAYVPGRAFYQLMKKEKNVQENKEILIRNKKTNIVYGGKAVRSTIGLPDTGSATVEPGNHGDFDVFVQSLSRNRKLPRGTQVLIEVV